MRIETDKAFLDGELVLFKDIPNEIKYNENRLSYTSLKTLNQCPFRFKNETWEDIGLSENDNTIHGTVGHYLIAEYLQHCFKDNFNEGLFKQEAMTFSENIFTYDRDLARHKVKPSLTYLKGGFSLQYVSRKFDYTKYLDKVEGYLDRMSNLLYSIPYHAIKAIYIETGIYIKFFGKVIFGKADLIIEFYDGTYTIVDHKSSFNTMLFDPAQLSVYGMLLGLPIKDLAVFELSSGSFITYDDTESSLKKASNFIIKGAKNLKSNEFIVGEHCTGCPVRCQDSITDDEGYITF